MGDRHQLTARQRLAVRRGACSDASRARRRASRLQVSALHGRALAIDGFNCLITVEALLAKAPLFRGRDRCATWRACTGPIVRSPTEQAAARLAALVARHQPAHVLVLLDRPVGNSACTRALLEATLESVALAAEVRLSEHVDDELVASGRVVASSDAGILERAPAWVDLPAALMDQVDAPWLIDLTDSGAL